MADVAYRRSYTARADDWWMVLLQGLALLALAAALFFIPGPTLNFLLVFLGAYWLTTGIFSLVEIRTRSNTTSGGWLLARGILGILAGLTVILYPLFTGAELNMNTGYIIGTLGVLFGIVSLINAATGEGGWATVMGVLSIAFGLLLFGLPTLALGFIVGTITILALAGALWLFAVSWRYHHKAVV